MACSDGLVRVLRYISNFFALTSGKHCVTQGFWLLKNLFFYQKIDVRKKKLTVFYAIFGSDIGDKQLLKNNANVFSFFNSIPWPSELKSVEEVKDSESNFKTGIASNEFCAGLFFLGIIQKLILKQLS